MIDMAASPEESGEGEAMSDNELAALLAGHEATAVGYYTSDIADEQAKAIDYYYGRPFGDEREGRSQVVERTVAITVDNALAALLKPFVSAEDVVSFEPRGPEDVEVAEQATEYVNYCFQCDNPGFLILHDWFKDALLTKLGIVKYWWEDKSKQSVAQHMVDAMQLQDARSHESYLDEQDNGDGSYTVSMQKTDEDGRVKVQNIPPEEFLISPFARSIEEAPYVAHRPSNMTRSDLIDMGFDAEVVEGLSAFAQSGHEESRSQARYQDEQWNNGSRTSVGNDKSRDVIGVIDEFIKVDYDGDGIAELRRVIRVSDTILLNEEVDEAPFAILCPVPMPHKVYGLSLADQVIDLQRIASVVWRQTLDNLYLSNNPRPIVPDGAANDETFDDMMDPSPGSFIRIKGNDPNALGFQTVPFVAEKSFGMLQYIEGQTEARSGFRRAGNGLDRDSLKKGGQITATQAAMMESKENERAEMIGRIFAETGVTRLFKGLLNLVSKYQPKARMIRLRNKWVEIDPRGWPEMDVRISVGLGIGNKMDQIAQADSILETMAELQATPYAYLIDAEKVHAAVKRKFQAAGIKNTDEYLVDPTQSEPPQPQPSPEQQKVQDDIQRGQAEFQMKAQQADAEHQLKTQLAQAQLVQSQQESAAKLEQMQQEAALKLQLERDKAAAQVDLDRERMAAEMQLAHERQALELDLAERNAARSHEIALTTAQAKISANRAGGDLDK